MESLQSTVLHLATKHVQEMYPSVGMIKMGLLAAHKRCQVEITGTTKRSLSTPVFPIPAAPFFNVMDTMESGKSFLVHANSIAQAYKTGGVAHLGMG